MTNHDAELARLRALCPGAELWDEGGAPLVYLPGIKVASAGTVQVVDALLCPRARDGYESRLYFSERLPVERNWQSHVLMARTWFAFSWNGIPANQPWLDILGSHLEAAK